MRATLLPSLATILFTAASAHAEGFRALQVSGARPLRRAGAALLAALAVGLLASAPAAAVTLQFETPISGDVVPVTAELTELPGGEGVAIDLALPEGAGDLLGLFGNVADESLVPSMSVGDPDGVLTQWQFEADGVRKVGGGNATAPVQGWDWGVKIGATGSPDGVRVEAAHFELRAPGRRRNSSPRRTRAGCWAFASRARAARRAPRSSGSARRRRASGSTRPRTAPSSARRRRRSSGRSTGPTSRWT